jgi:predicted NBD/HSP70 family sugar kinase
MHSVGIDLHRKRSHVAVIDEAGEQLLSRRILSDPQTVLALLESKASPARPARTTTRRRASTGP